MTNINEAKIAKAALQKCIELMLREFTRDTGLAVERVELEKLFTVGEVPDYVVDVEVRL